MISLRKVDCSMRSQKEKNKEIEIEIEGNLEDLLTEEELKQLEEDEYLDGGPGNIPNWSRHYKPKEPKKNDSEEIQEIVVPVTEEEIAERIRKGNYEWTEYDGDDTAHQFDDLTPEELEEKMEELRKKLFGNRTDKK